MELGADRGAGLGVARFAREKVADCNPSRPELCFELMLFIPTWM